MAGFDVDTAQLRGFATIVDGISDRMASMSGVASSAELVPGTFTRTAAGRRLDLLHAVTMRRVHAAVNSAVQQLGSGADTVLATTEDYTSRDTTAANTFDALRPTR